MCCVVDSLKSVLFQNSNTTEPQLVSFLVEGLHCFPWLCLGRDVCRIQVYSGENIFKSWQQSMCEHMCNEINWLFCYKMWWVPTGGMCSGRRWSGAKRLSSHSPNSLNDLHALLLFLILLDHSCGQCVALLVLSMIQIASQQYLLPRICYFPSLPSFSFPTCSTRE